VADGPRWPGLAHPLGVDSLGRDFVTVLAHGAVDFAVPGVLATLGLWAVMAAVAGGTLLGDVLPRGAGPGDGAPGGAGSSGGLVAASPPRLLLVMLGMLLLDEPSPALAAAIVLGLHLPVALHELAGRLRDLREQEVLAGILAHGVPFSRVLLRHLLLGWLRAPLARHGAALFTQVAFTQVALAYLFGTSHVSPGLAVSWGMEFRRLSAAVPGPRGFVCEPGQVCAAAVSTFHAAVLLLLALGLLGSLVRASRPRPGEGVAA
jgi:hypothetical protein